MQKEKGISKKVVNDELKFKDYKNFIWENIYEVLNEYNS